MSFRKIGGIWVKKDRKGRLYGAGGIILNGREMKLVVYENEKKKAKSNPDYIIYQQQYDREKQG